MNEPRILKYGRIEAVSVAITGATLMILTVLFAAINVPKAYKLQQITYDVADQIGDDDGNISATVQRRAHNLLIDYALVPPYACKAAAGTGIFLGFLMINTGWLIWKLTEVLKRNPQQSGAAYVAQGAPSADP